MLLPEASLGRVLDRVEAIWHPALAPHHLLLGQTGSGKTSLIKRLLELRPGERAVVLDPKPHPDPAWLGPPGDPWRWGRPVTALEPMFGRRQEGGGPYGRWFRLCGTPDRDETARRFAAGLDILGAEGHCVAALDDVREMRALRQSVRVDSLMNLGRSANILAILSATQRSFVAGREQAAMIWAGHTSGMDAAKAKAGLLGWRGREREDICLRIGMHEWIFSEDQPGSAGPVLIRPDGDSR